MTPAMPSRAVRHRRRICSPLQRDRWPEAMLAALEERGLKPAGAASSRLYVLHGREAAYDQHPDKKFFKLSFEDISVHVLMEILDLTDPQKSRFEEAYEVCKVVMEKAKIFPATPADQQQALDLDELDGGWPKMTIEMMLDIVTWRRSVSATRKPSSRASHGHSKVTRKPSSRPSRCGISNRIDFHGSLSPSGFGD